MFFVLSNSNLPNVNTICFLCNTHWSALACLSFDQYFRISFNNATRTPSPVSSHVYIISSE